MGFFMGIVLHKYVCTLRIVLVMIQASMQEYVHIAAKKHEQAHTWQSSSVENAQ